MIAIPSIRAVANRSSMAEKIVFTTTKSLGTWGGSNTASITFTDAQRLVVEYAGTGWNGGTATVTYGTGTGYGTQTVNISRACSGAGSKTITVYPTDSSGQRRGRITGVVLSFLPSSTTNTQITNVDFKGCRNLTTMWLQTPVNALTGTLDFSGMKELSNCYIISGNGGLTEVNLSGCSNLTTLYLTNLTGLTTMTGLSDTATTLQNLYLDNSVSLTSVNVNNFLNLFNLSLKNCNSLTSLRAQNCTLENYGYSGYGGYAYIMNGGADLQNTSSMTTAAVEQFYTDLGSVSSPGLIAVYGSGGWNADPTIATAKGYTVIGNVPP